MFQKTGQVVYKTARRIVIAVTGGTIVLLGTVMLLTPGPGLLVIVAGLGILGLEFAWAKRWLAQVKKRSGQAIDSVRKNGKKGHYFTLQQQALHYFTRPHSRLLRKPSSSPAAWLSADIRDENQWLYTLNNAQIEEIRSAIDIAKSRLKHTWALSTDDFPLPTLADDFDKWREQIDHGLGFQVIRGLPVDDWSLSDLELFFWCFGLHFGTPGVQNGDKELISHLRALSPSEGNTVQQTFRCDAVDIQATLCLRQDGQYNSNQIVSSISIYNEILRTQPELIKHLYQPFILTSDSNDEDANPTVTPCRYFDGQLRTFFDPRHFHQGPPFQKQLVEAYKAIANSEKFHLPIHLKAGDIQLLSNHKILHTHPANGNTNHFLRLSLSIPNNDKLIGRILRFLNKKCLSQRLTRFNFNHEKY